jgi:hypothetical protein
VFIEPNGLRELHWHTKDGRYAYVFVGALADRICRMALHSSWSRSGNCVFGVKHSTDIRFPGGLRRMSMFSVLLISCEQVGDTGVFPVSYGHYVRRS